MQYNKLSLSSRVYLLSILLLLILFLLYNYKRITLAPNLGGLSEIDIFTYYKKYNIKLTYCIHSELKLTAIMPVSWAYNVYSINLPLQLFVSVT